MFAKYLLMAMAMMNVVYGATPVQVEPVQVPAVEVSAMVERLEDGGVAVVEVAAADEILLLDVPADDFTVEPFAGMEISLENRVVMCVYALEMEDGTVYGLMDEDGDVFEICAGEALTVEPMADEFYSAYFYGNETVSKLDDVILLVDEY